MKTTATNRKIGLLLNQIDNGLLIPNPDFQRRLVWSSEDKLSFIETVLDGFPFPEIYIAAGDVNTETGASTEMLVDGQQRITTLYQYFKGSKDIKLSKSIPAYRDLSEDRKKEFLSYEVVIRDLGNMSINEIKAIFQKINSTSYGLNSMEIDNARYDGHFKKFGEEMSEHPFFEKHKIFSATDIHRMNDVLYCLTLISTVISTYFNLNKEVEVFLNQYNDSFPQYDELKKKIWFIFDFIDDMNFSETSRIYKKSDFFTLFVELYRLLYIQESKITPNSSKPILESFYKEVDSISNGSILEKAQTNVELYYNALIQGTNSRKSRITRGDIINMTLMVY